MSLGVWVCFGGVLGVWLPDRTPFCCHIIGGDTPDLGPEGEGDFGALAKGNFGTLVSTLGPRPICLYLGKFLIFYLMLFYLEPLKILLVRCLTHFWLNNREFVMSSLPVNKDWDSPSFKFAVLPSFIFSNFRLGESYPCNLQKYTQSTLLFIFL